MLSRCHTQRSSGCTISWVRWDDTSTRSLLVTRWISPNLTQPLNYEPIMTFHTRNIHPSHQSISLFYLPKIPFSPFWILTHFFFKNTLYLYLKCDKMSNKVLSILAGFIIQTEQIIFRDKSRSSRNGHSNQGVAIQPFSSKTICNFINRIIGLFCNTRFNMHQRMRLVLSSSKPSGNSFSRYGSFRLAVLVSKILSDLLSVSYDDDNANNNKHKQAQI